MSGFDAAEFVEPLDWSFRPHVDASGTTPEPSDRQLAKFARDFLEANGVTPGATPDERAARALEIEKFSDDDLVAFMEKLRVAVAEVTGGSPSREQIDELPRRVLMQYAGWLYVQLTNPPKPATTSSPATSI